MNRSRETKRNGGQLFHENEKKKTKKKTIKDRPWFC